MRIRIWIGATLAALALTTVYAPAASATAWVDHQPTCMARHDFTEFFRNHDPNDKYCYQAATGPKTVTLNLDHVTWFHAGNNEGEFTFVDGATGEDKWAYFPPGSETGCTDCFIKTLTLYR